MKTPSSTLQLTTHADVHRQSKHTQPPQGSNYTHLSQAENSLLQPLQSTLPSSVSTQEMQAPHPSNPTNTPKKRKITQTQHCEIDSPSHAASKSRSQKAQKAKKQKAGNTKSKSHHLHHHKNMLLAFAALNLRSLS